MPKTYTDDIAAALPSSLDGPFTVVDPNDAAAYFNIDPAQARVEAAGGARPIRRVNLGFYKTVGTTLAGTIGTGMGSRIVGVGNNGGYLCNAIGVPIDMDLSAPANVKVMLSPIQIVSGSMASSTAKGGNTKSQSVTFCSQSS